MDFLKQNWQIITVLLTSSFLGAILAAMITGLINWRLSSRNFKYKSYEEIVKRRFQAYEKISRVQLSFNLYISDKTGITPYVFANGIQGLEDFQLTLIEAFSESFWLNEEVGSVMTELTVYIHNVDDEAKNNGNTDPNNELILIAKRDADKIKAIKSKLAKQLRNDLINIHKVENFIRKNTEQKPEYKVMTWK